MSRQARRFLARKGERSIGFTPFISKRIQAAFAAAMLTYGNEGSAWAAVARTLPPPRRVFNWNKRPTKNADPAYRKSIWPAAKVQARGQ